MNLVFQSESMRSLLARVKLVASTEANVLVSGECGVGKKSLARQIHDISLPDGAPLVCISCSGLERDSREGGREYNTSGFVSASPRLRQLIASAAGGTLLLDEVANLSGEAQETLLEHLLERELSESRELAKSRRPTRILCTSRVSATELMRCGLRDGLFHRLYELHLSIPPLRERLDDIPPLAEHFLLQLRQQHLLSVSSLDPEAVARLQRHDWPGNARELRNTLFRACFVSTRDTLGVQEIEASMLPSAVESPQQYDQLKLEDVERRVILRRLDRFHGNKAKAAIDLGVTDRTLRNKMRHYRESGQLQSENGSQ